MADYNASFWAGHNGSALRSAALDLAGIVHALERGDKRLALAIAQGAQVAADKALAQFTEARALRDAELAAKHAAWVAEIAGRAA